MDPWLLIECTAKTLIRLSDWAEAQADLSLPWVDISFCWFCHETAHLLYGFLSYEPGHAKMCLMPYVNNKGADQGADQPAHPRSLISAFVVCSLDSIISLVSRSKISRF